MSIRGRLLFALLFPVLLLTLVGQWDRSRDRLRCSQILRLVEQTSAQMVRSGQAARPGLRSNLRLLRESRELDRSEVAVPFSIAGLQLLLNRPREAIAWYDRALALEPRPEIYFNRGRALLVAGEAEDARREFRRAVKLDPRLRKRLPPEVARTRRFGKS